MVGCIGKLCHDSGTSQSKTGGLQFNPVPSCLGSVEDGGPQAKTGTISIIVNVIDSNDNKPVFVGGPNFEVSVVENTLPGTVIIRLEAHDADEGFNGEVRYDFAPSTRNSPAARVFAIRNDTGELTVKVCENNYSLPD